MRRELLIAIGGRLQSDGSVRIGPSDVELRLNGDTDTSFETVGAETAAAILEAEFESAQFDELPAVLHPFVFRAMDLVGSRRAANLLQRAINRFVVLRAIDGDCGPVTIRAAETALNAHGAEFVVELDNVVTAFEAAHASA